MRETARFRALIVLALGAGLLVSAAARAQPRSGPDRHKWWLSDQVKTEVGLTVQQSADLEAVFQSFLPRLRAGWEDLERVEQDVSRLMTDDTTDEARISAAIDRAEVVRASLNKTRTLMLFKMYRVLSHDQRVKLTSFHDRRSRDRQSDPGGRK